MAYSKIGVLSTDDIWVLSKASGRELRFGKRKEDCTSFLQRTLGLLICTLISENQGLEKSRSVSNLRKISGPANLDFFSRSPPRKKLGLYYKSEKNPADKPKKKKSRFAGPEIFLWFEADLDFSRP